MAKVDVFEDHALAPTSVGSSQASLRSLRFPDRKMPRFRAGSEKKKCLFAGLQWRYPGLVWSADIPFRLVMA